jgi:hypothetical protein
MKKIIFGLLLTFVAINVNAQTFVSKDSLLKWTFEPDGKWVKIQTQGEVFISNVRSAGSITSRVGTGSALTTSIGGGTFFKADYTMDNYSGTLFITPVTNRDGKFLIKTGQKIVANAKFMKALAKRVPCWVTIEMPYADGIIKHEVYFESVPK